MDAVRALCEEIVRRFHPRKVILFSRKLDLEGGLRSFKICVVADEEDESEALRRLYLQADCPIPYDAVIYTPDRFERLREQEGSFAQRIDRTGCVLYG